ncbi:hypothetical protein [uncultured Nostoc sp.]|uniref:hypothetical protein n=1 Tax=uncultured Nostoc sp. TaxID=340711 RepID=UPI0035CA2C6F
MSIENLFGGLVNDGKSKLSGIGSNPTKIGNMGSPLSRIKEKMILPSEISAQQVINSEKDLAYMEGEVELAKDIADKQGKQLDKLLELHKVNVGFTQKVMNVDQQLRTVEAQHGRNVSRYMLGAAETQASLDGYQEAYKMSAEIFQ